MLTFYGNCDVTSGFGSPGRAESETDNVGHFGDIAS